MAFPLIFDNDIRSFIVVSIWNGVLAQLKLTPVGRFRVFGYIFVVATFFRIASA
ncbi:MAG: hypothetical protein IGS38_08130 [Synechococcales cyanobacterium M58_A2018_015]|nr:hypothetical protein [Synechococcales cyanobacterium M58_A2018_015]